MSVAPHIELAKKLEPLIDAADALCRDFCEMESEIDGSQHWRDIEKVGAIVECAYYSLQNLRDYLLTYDRRDPFEGFSIGRTPEHIPEMRLGAR